MAAKLVRYPGVEDHALALREYDRKAFYKARQQLVDLRNVYTVVLDILRKNIDRISKPKSGNRECCFAFCALPRPAPRFRELMPVLSCFLFRAEMGSYG